MHNILYLYYLPASITDVNVRINWQHKTMIRIQLQEMVCDTVNNEVLSIFNYPSLRLPQTEHPS